MKGSLSELEPAVEPPLLSGPHWQGSHELHQVAAEVLWSHLLVGKAKRQEYAKKINQSQNVTRLTQTEKKEDKHRTSMQIALSRHYSKSRCSGHVHCECTHLHIL